MTDKPPISASGCKHPGRHNWVIRRGDDGDLWWCPLCDALGRPARTDDLAAARCTADVPPAREMAAEQLAREVGRLRTKLEHAERERDEFKRQAAELQEALASVSQQSLDHIAEIERLRERLIDVGLEVPR